MTDETTAIKIEQYKQELLAAIVETRETARQYALKGDEANAALFSGTVIGFESALHKFQERFS